MFLERLRQRNTTNASPQRIPQDQAKVRQC